MKLSILEFQADIRVMKADVVALEAALLNRLCPQGFEQDKFDYFKTLTLDEKKKMIGDNRMLIETKEKKIEDNKKLIEDNKKLMIETKEVIGEVVPVVTTKASLPTLGTPFDMRTIGTSAGDTRFRAGALGQEILLMRAVSPLRVLRVWS
jgi:hypothetical protein